MLWVVALVLAGLHGGWLQLAVERRARRHVGRLHVAEPRPAMLWVVALVLARLRSGWRCGAVGDGTPGGCIW